MKPEYKQNRKYKDIICSICGNFIISTKEYPKEPPRFCGKCGEIIEYQKKEKKNELK
jgi:formylmethanofuran dehydrogenase subunit E